MPVTRALLTAFGSFPGAPVNPTMAILALVTKRHGRRLARLGVELHTAVLPVEYAGAQERALELIARARPDAALHLGLAAGRRRLSFETRALNRVGALRCDAARRRSASALVEPGGPAVRRSRAPVAACVAAITKAGAGCAPSIDAGDYLCNQTLYASLAAPTPLVAFLHVPRPRRARARRGQGRRRATLSQMADGVAAALVEMAKASRR